MTSILDVLKLRSVFTKISNNSKNATAFIRSKIFFSLHYRHKFQNITCRSIMKCTHAINIVS